MSGFSGSGEGTSFLDDIPPPLTPENVSRFSHSQGEEETPKEETTHKWKEGEEVDKGPPFRPHMSRRGTSSGPLSPNAMARNRKGGSVIGARGQIKSPPLVFTSNLSLTEEEKKEDEEKKKKNTPRGFFSGRKVSSKGKAESTFSDGAIREGWLQIKRSGKGSMKKYWFVVTFGGCAYYSDQTMKSKRGNIELKKSSCRVVLRGSASEQCIFGLITQNRDYDLKAEAVDDVSHWIQAFEAALTNDIVGRVSKFSSSQENHFCGVTEDVSKYDALIDILAGPEGIDLLGAVSEPVAKKDERNLAACLIHAFELRKNTFTLLRYLISKSVDDCKVATTLFRGNSLTEKALTIYCHLVGTNYLQRCLKPLFLSVVNSDADYEIDPSRVSAKSSVDANVMNLLSVSQMFMAKITASKFTNVPYGIRHVSRFLSDITKEKFPDGLYSIIGGLFFLRFVCPALLIPQDLGIYDGVMQPEAKRALLLISKTLMNLSNGVKFGKKEQYMTPMNDFIVGNEVAIRKFFDSLILKPEDQDEAQREDETQQLQAEEKRISSVQADPKMLGELTTHISTYFEQIKTFYLEKNGEEGGELSEEEKQKREERMVGLKEAIDAAL